MTTPTAPDAQKTPTDLVAFRQKFTTLTPKQRLDALVDCHDVIRVVRSMPVQDLYITLRDVGPTDALEVVELMHPRQVQGVLDLDGWRRDRLDPMAIGGWLELLYAASPSRAVQQIAGLDTELLALLLKLHTRVYDMTEEGEVPELPADEDVGLHSITPDRRYLVIYNQTAENEKLVLALKTTIERMFGADLPFITHMLQAVRFELPSGLEEEALRWRRGRLEDLGFGDPDEAGMLFAWFDPDGSTDGLIHPADPDVVGADIDPQDPPRNLSTSVLLPDMQGEQLYQLAVRSLDDKHRERVQHELMMCVNQLHMAEGKDLGDAGAMRDSMQRALDTLGIALAYRTQGDVEAAARLLVATPQRTLFRMGHSLALRLQRELRRHLTQKGSGLDGAGILRLDTPLREVAAGILAKRPVYFLGLTAPQRTDFRHFASLVEVAQAAKAISEAAFRARLMHVSVGVDDDALRAAGVTPDDEPPTFGMLLATTLLQQWLDKPLEVRPLDDDELQEVAKRLRGQGGFADDDKARLGTIAAAFGKAAFAEGQLVGADNVDTAEQRAQAFAELVLTHVERQLLAITDDVIDSKHVDGVWTASP